LRNHRRENLSLVPSHKIFLKAKCVDSTAVQYLRVLNIVLHVSCMVVHVSFQAHARLPWFGLQQSDIS